jgi:hypothetical protein
MSHKFYVKEVPDPHSVWGWIKQNTDIERRARSLQSKVDTTRLINLNHTFDIDDLSKTTLNALDKFGFLGWRSDDGDGREYGGLSLAYNPEYTEDCDPNQQTLGTIKNNGNEFFYGQIQKFKTIRNSYFDTLAFRHYPPCVTETGLKDFFDSFKSSSVRARLAVINAQYVTEEARPKFGWHKDETVFENLRINIPIKTDETFMFQLLNQTPEHLHYGNMYSWDTYLPHRVFPNTDEVRNRIHLVLGFCPWFDYNVEEDSWTSNEFYGEMHPIDMLVEGYIHEKIKGIK